MNPLTLGVYALHEQLRLLLDEPPPGRTTPAAARVVLSGTTDKQLLEALRLYENQPANQVSFAVHREAIVTEAGLLAHARLQLQGDADSVRAFSMRAGAELPQHRVPTMDSVEAFAREVARWSETTTALLDSVCVTLQPAQVVDGKLWLRLVAAMRGIAAPPRRVLLVRDDATEALRKLVPHEIRFHVDRGALWKWAKEAKSSAAQGPAREDAPRLAPDARKALERSIGRRLMSEDNGIVLKHLLLDAGQALGEGKTAVAAKKFRAARTYCQMLGLQKERATCAASIGALRFAEGKPELALRAFEDARAIAEAHGVLGVRLQAGIGIATTLLSMGAYEKARAAYDACRELAKDYPSTRIECLRMRGHTFSLEKRPGDAVVAWQEALGEVEALSPLVRSTTAYRLIADHLADELAKVGRGHEAAHVKGRAEAITSTIQAATEELRRAEFRGEGVAS